MEDKKWKLFALPPTEENLEKAEKSRFCRVTADYILIYAEESKGVEITGENRKRLTDWDRRWLADCRMILDAEQLKQRAKVSSGELLDYLDALEEALKREAEGNG